MSDKSLRERIAYALFGDVIERHVNTAISVRVDDSPGWDPLAGGGPHDRPWSDFREDLDDALEAWQKNFMVRRIVTLSRSYVVSGGIEISSKHRQVDKFIHSFWNHPENRMQQRLGPMCDELTRTGELFPVLFTNKADGMSYIRFVPASRIREIETDEDDYEKELSYGQLQDTTTELKWWQSPYSTETNIAADRKPPPVMLHFTVNKPIGATRGESDLTPILKWALRYSEWLQDRVRLNRVRTRQGILHLQVADDQVKKKHQQYTRQSPLKAGILVTGKDEEAHMLNLNIRAEQAEPDGKALRLAIATGSNLALHYLGEGESTNYSTAKEMGEPTARFYTDRQTDFCGFLKELITVAYGRHLLVRERTLPKYWKEDLQLQASVTEVARTDNLTLAQAAKDVVTALSQMKAEGWIDDRTAIQIAFKFAGELIGEDEIDTILSQPQQPQEQDEND